VKAIIVANGELSLPENWKQVRDDGDVFIAADGGSLHMLGINLLPDFVVGDLDSLPEAVKKKLLTTDVEFVEFPAEKDETDLELALLQAKKLGAKEVAVIAALGRRWDQSLANILLAANPQFKEMQIEFLHAEEKLFLISNEIELEAEIGVRLSLIPVGGDAMGIRTKGLHFALNGEDLIMGSSRGISNHFVQKKAKVSLMSGILLCVISPKELI
jgi:thiamine pyrophosphokinase